MSRAGAWEVVIGLEVHVQLNTRSKLFSGAAIAYGAEPNTQACAVDLALPGVLPVLNREAVAKAIRFGLAIDATVARQSVFARKNYFYPDLPKGYQISQYEEPVVQGGHLDIEVEDQVRRITLTRAHLEEDAGKSLHEDIHGFTGIDLNRAGTPLLEIVSEPVLRSATEAVAYLRKLRTLVRTLDIGDGNMQEGSLRCDANVSLRPRGSQTLGTRTEIKNVNSFRFLERAINHEIERQREILEDGGTIVQETRLYDADRDETRSMRSKEEANDYRYFPDPDLLPLVIDEAWIEAIRESLPELPDARFARFCDELGLRRGEAAQLTADPEVADYFEAVLKAAGDGDDEFARLAANWVCGELAAALNDGNLGIGQSPLTPSHLAGLLNRLRDGTLSGKLAKEVFAAIWAGEGDADQIITARGLQQISDVDALAELVEEVLAANPQQVAQYRAGKEKLLGFFVGKVMQATQGKANPGQVNQLIRQRLAPD